MYTLEKVFKMKKDAFSHVVFFDEAMKVGTFELISHRNNWQKSAFRR